MKALILCASLIAVLFAPAASTAAGFDHSYKAYAAILTNHVKDGAVNYRALSLNPDPLRSVLGEFSKATEADFALWTRAKQSAFLINVYNAHILMLVATNYPTTSVRRLGRGVTSPWQLPIVRILGRSTTLEAIVQGPLRRGIEDPRVHYALCQGAKGSPPLRSEPYLPEKLDEQFADQAKVFLADPARNRVDAKRKVLWLSPVFLWYGADFTNREPNLIKVIRPHTATATAEMIDAATVDEPVKFDFADFNWDLNEYRPGSKP